MIIQTRKSFKYRIYPTKAQITNLENQFSMCRHLYNGSLAERKEAYEKSGESISYNAQQNRLPILKKERPWYKGVYSQVLQKVVYHRKIPQEAKIKTMTITRQGGKWFACFSVALTLDIEPKQGLQNCMGIDLGLNDFLYASDGSHSINDAGWYPFLRYVRYKAIEQGKRIVSVPVHHTSHKCSVCGHVVKKSLSVRTHRCPCGFVANRDHNAAINILRVGLDTLAASAA